MTIQSYLDDFGALIASAGAGPAWLGSIRRTAIERFRVLGFPTRHNEDWHFTSVGPITEAEFTSLRTAGGSAAGAEVGPEEIAPFLFEHPEWPRLVFVNGQFAPELSVTRGVPPGVRITTLSSALAAELPAVRAHLTHIASFEDNAFAALNTALFTEGAVIQIPASVALDLPVHILHVTNAEAARGVMYPRALVIVEPQARATVVESYVALGSATYFTNAVTELQVSAGAAVAHLRVQQESERSFHVGLAQTQQHRDSRYASFSFATGAALSRANIYTSLIGPGAEVTLDGLYLVDGEQHVDHQTRIEHVAPNCASHEVYKGILDGKAHGVFNGKVFVHPEAQKTDGKQTNNNLLLSADAQVDTKPQLEIFADDVKCTHGATVGQLDEVALFYLKSRGFPADEARTLLTYAFAADVLERIEQPAVREVLQSAVRARFVDVPALAAS